MSKCEQIMGDIGWAVEQIRNGKRVCRADWNDKGMWLQLESPGGRYGMSVPYVYMNTVEGRLVPWQCSQSALLADDWVFAGKQPA